MRPSVYSSIVETIARSIRPRSRSASTISSSRPGSLMSRSISTRSSGGSRKASSASVSASGVRRSASCQSWATTSGAPLLERQVRVGQPEHVELDRVDAGLDRGPEALQRVAGGDRVGALVADQAQLSSGIGH